MTSLTAAMIDVDHFHGIASAFCMAFRAFHILGRLVFDPLTIFIDVVTCRTVLYFGGLIMFVM
jgi:uncharacterized MAPEG superfamily protein